MRPFRHFLHTYWYELMTICGRRKIARDATGVRGSQLDSTIRWTEVIPRNGEKLGMDGFGRTLFEVLAGSCDSPASFPLRVSYLSSPILLLA